MLGRCRRLLGWLWRRPLALAAAGALVGLLGFAGYRACLRAYAAHHLQAAQRAEARYDFDEAEGHLAACLWVRPEDASLHFRMARTERRAGGYEQAAEHLRRCQQLEGVNARNALEGAMLKAQLGEVAAVEDFLQGQVEHRSPETDQILEALAQGYVYTYRLDAAKDCLDRLLEREPDNVQARVWCAQVWALANKFEKAEADLRHAVQVQPEHLTARWRLGNLLSRRNRVGEALVQFEYARQLPGGDRPEVLLGLAYSHRQLGDRDKAQKVLDELLARHPQDAAALAERGALALEDGSPAAAEGFLRRALAVEPFDPQANFLLVQALRGQGQEEEARRYEATRQRLESDLKSFAAAFARVNKAPADPAPRREIGLICLRNGQEREGERWLLSALQQAPQDPATHAALADYYERAGKPDRAAEHRRQAQQSHPGAAASATPASP